MIADLITDYSVLQPDVQPDREVIVHRDGEIDHLMSVLAPLTHDVAPGGAFLYGPPGSGKTCTTHCVLEELVDETDVEIVFIDCLSSHARRSVLKRVLEELGAAAELEHRSVATDDLSALVREAIDGPTVLVLDECDQLDDFRVLHELYGIKDLTLVLISNAPWKAFEPETQPLNSRVQSLQEIPFSRYTETQLVSILEERSRAGVESGVVSDSDLEYIVSKVDERDARQTISLLYHSVRNLSLGGRATLSKSVIDAAKPDSTKDIIRSRLSSLSRQQRVALECLADVGPGTSSELYECYRERVDEPRTDRTVRGWLPKFEKYGLTTIDGPEYEPVYEVREAVLKELSVPE
ncbi:Cdc6/Cdc18 family protein [Halomontanus rarus]|uniref:Cdc6/Cdc18 family protein n=1 Tax=Halomontanus rarus TaxID=3034020 RepID=UPI0023E8A880|nr:Cdc6/Cdc18 family protein [Halovivax sp. TS33]